ncbi:MAG: SDR family NAD(P)-dependent oxidoreductase, partial [Xanthomonadales bacterium]|nr:SDR family NAD(P)-dependent oxidoreductase [Xanthomonadales bacterium]
NTASVAGLCAGPGLTAYCASKFAVVGLGESLRAELKGRNIGVSSICPGIINTRIVDDARINIKPGAAANSESLTRFYRRRGWSPDRVARAAVKAVRKNRSVVPVAPEAWLMWLVKRFSQRGHDLSAYLLGRRLMEP